MHKVTLDPQTSLKLTWMVDFPDETVFFQVKNGITKKYNWFAIGFSRRGELPLTDFCIFQRSGDDDDKIDTIVVSHKFPFTIHSLFPNWGVISLKILMVMP